MRQYVALAVGCLLAAAGPAEAAAPFLLLEEGYNQVELAVEWAQPNAYFRPPGLLVDATGNAYQLAGADGIGESGPRIVKLSEQGVSTFAETDGPGHPRFVAFAFDDNLQMIVVVERWVSLRGRGSAIARSYHRIRGFPEPESRLLAPRVQALLERAIPGVGPGDRAIVPFVPLLLCALLLAVAFTVMLRQVVYDARHLRDRG